MPDRSVFAACDRPAPPRYFTKEVEKFPRVTNGTDPLCRRQSSRAAKVSRLTPLAVHPRELDKLDHAQTS
jgi:hypothetical protein